MSTPLHDHHSHRGAAVGQFIYVIDALVLAAIAAVFVIGGLSPFESPVMTIVFLVSLAGVAVHHFWRVRNLEDIEHDPATRQDRERRGF